MVKIELETSTLAILIAGLYCVNHNRRINSKFIQ